MSKYSMRQKVFSKYMDKGLPCYYVYGYFKIIVNVLKSINTLVTHCVTSAFHL
jgi:hypothetical protein